MKVSLVFAVSLISLVAGDELRTEMQQTLISRGKEDDKGKGDRKHLKHETKDGICNDARNVAVKSVYVAEDYFQLFIESLDGSKGWTVYTTGTKSMLAKYPEYFPQSSGSNQLGQFGKMGEIQDSPELKNDGKFERVSASFIYFSNCVKEYGYLVSGLSAHEFVIGRKILRNYYPTGKVKPITDFFEEKLLKPADKLAEIVSVALIKWVEKDQIKDHAIYKIILKTTTKKLVKAYFKLTNKGEFITLNSKPFVPSVEELQENNEFNLLEESALFDVRKLNELSVGYQFTKEFAFPIYYEYNPEKNTYKEYPMRTKNGFNSDLEKLDDKILAWDRHIVPTETWLGCRETTFCFGRSFDAVLFAGNQYYAIFGEFVYTLASITSTPGVGVSLNSLFPAHWFKQHVDAAFTIGSMVFFIDADRVYYMTGIDEKPAQMLYIKEVFPDIDIPVLAVITLDKGKEVSENKPQPSELKSARLRKYHRRHERADQTTEEDIPKQMVYVYCSDNDGGNVYQYEMETKEPPKFTRVAKKTYKEVNAALPHHITLVFTAEDKVVTMVNHFMIVQSSLTFFTQTEKLEKFTLVDKYFGCHIGNIEKKLTKEFVQKYVKFAGPKPGVNFSTKPEFTQKSTEPLESSSEGRSSDSNNSPSKDSKTMSSTEETHGSNNVDDDEDKSEAKDSGKSAKISTSNFIIQAVAIIVVIQILF